MGKLSSASATTHTREKKEFHIVAAATLKGGIGNNGKLPWNIPQDMKMFSTLTKTVQHTDKFNCVIMGRKTYESIPKKHIPLIQRLNIILSNTLPATEITPSLLSVSSLDRQSFIQHPIIVKSLESALELAFSDVLAGFIENIFVIGGSRVFSEALQHPLLTTIFLTRVTGQAIECDSFVPEFSETIPNFYPVTISKTYAHQGLSYDFVEFRRLDQLNDTHIEKDSSVTPSFDKLLIYLEQPSCIPDHFKECIKSCPTVKGRFHEEFQYLDLIADILMNGKEQTDRTGVGTIATFGAHMRFDLKHSFPLLTTKSVFWRGVVEELLWFIRGETNSHTLSSKGIKIWDANGSREFLDLNGFHNRLEGDLGPIYGFQWRHFGASYETMHTNYHGKGIDQLQHCIELLKSNPYSRRIILTAWNPSHLQDMALPPCHILCQFFVTTNQELSCLMYQRSADLGLGVPFNIASYSLLCCMMAQICHLKRGEFIHVLGNAHVYLNHIDPLKIQLQRYPKPFPTLSIDPTIQSIDKFECCHFSLSGYSPHPKIPMEMAV